jgi:hypothetical protein
MYNKRKKIYQENKYEIKVINKLDDNNEENILIESSELEYVVPDDNKTTNINYKKNYMFEVEDE